MQSALEQMSTQANDTKLLRGIVVISFQIFPEIQEEENFPVQFTIELLDIKGRQKINATRIYPINIRELFLVNWQHVEGL